ncbi:PQQ-dependent sugar dehydrogenase [Mycolicibacterium sp. BiH015]|uniref:PQQ-dependent sugar dehydrogenase n=1 Tax=Mycolicibacterium sp. BiH015 TaxID=3018808 RepID=UPI0022E1D8CC|nr:PQQ-dependent sugar dehydrogenase [Mycolicibacterium sp. BiH015]MDA2891871.1 PQQ-dependent sugar dehydrogenase [Mycolicibacterium sp. BiH015]
MGGSPGYARYVGRVGGLAAALGIGAALLTGTAVASAETTDSSSTSSSSSDSDSSSETTRGATKASTGQSPSERAASDDSGDESEDAESDDTDTESEAADEDVDDNDVDDNGATDADDEEEAPAQALAAVDAEDEAAADERSWLEKLFDNESPTINPNPAENAVIDGNVVGKLNPEDPDSTRLTYRATPPEHGTVAFGADGTFVYSPDESYAGQDSFQVTVSDARDGFHIHGAAGLLNLFTFGLLGSSGHRDTKTVFIGHERATVVEGLSSPVDFRFLPDGRILVAEKAGAIRVVEDGELLADPLITLSVRTEVERGIAGLAVDPAFESNGRIYVAYVSAATTRNTLSRFVVTGNTAAFDRILVESNQAAAVNHHGGALDFGTDGKLYWGVGDNASGPNAQDLTDNIHGKILRLNTDGSVPDNNPLILGTRSAIYAYGLRNPFRLTFTPTGELLVADVGNAAFEEVNKVVAGGNYGWPSSEGVCTSSCAGKTDPIFTYARDGGAAITSVAVHQGKVFIADLVKGWINVLTCTPAYTACTDVQTFDPDAGATVVLSEGPDGALYQLLYQPGALVRIDLEDIDV